MRRIDRIVVHASGDREGQDATVRDLDRRFRARGYFSIGYHHVIARDGTVHAGRPKERAGVQNDPHNRTAIGVAYVGGLDAAGKQAADTRTPEQRVALRALLADLRRQHPEASIHGRYYGGMPGHDPQFNPTEEYRDL